MWGNGCGGGELETISKYASTSSEQRSGRLEHVRPEPVEGQFNIHADGFEIVSYPVALTGEPTSDTNVRVHPGGTSTASDALGGRTACRASSMLSTQSRSASCALRSASSIVEPIATHPGRSGKTTPYPPASPSINAGYLMSTLPARALGDGPRYHRRRRRMSRHCDTVGNRRMSIDVVIRPVSMEEPSLPLQPSPDRSRSRLHHVPPLYHAGWQGRR